MEDEENAQAQTAAAAERRPRSDKGKGSTKLRCSEQGSKLLSTLIQNRTEPMISTRLPELKLHAQTNIGEVLVGVLKSVGFGVGDNGELTHEDFDTVLTPACPIPETGSVRKGGGSRAMPKVAASGGDEPDGSPTPSCRHASAAGQQLPKPPTPPKLPTVRPATKAPRTARPVGTAMGNVLQPASRLCVLESSQLDELVMRVQQHERTCPDAQSLRRVVTDGWHPQSYSAGVVNAFTFTCASGCSCHWTSAHPTHRRTATTTTGLAARLAAAAVALLLHFLCQAV